MRCYSANHPPARSAYLAPYKKDGGPMPAVSLTSGYIESLEVYRHVRIDIPAQRIVHRREGIALAVDRIARIVQGIDGRGILVEHVIRPHPHRDLVDIVRDAQVEEADLG